MGVTSVPIARKPSWRKSAPPSAPTLAHSLRSPTFSSAGVMGVMSVPGARNPSLMKSPAMER
eukprot:355087-Chlamydomonas_euryale.AAC.4